MIVRLPQATALNELLIYCTGVPADTRARLTRHTSIKQELVHLTRCKKWSEQMWANAQRDGRPVEYR